MSRRAPLPWVTLGFVAATLLPATSALLHTATLYQREAILSGEVWRLFTAHWAHFGASHWGWNAALALLAGAWLEQRAVRRARLYWLTAPLAISLALLLLEPELHTYAGLSGVATGLVAMLAVVLWRGAPRDRAAAGALGVLLAIKLIAENATGQTAVVHFADEAVRPTPLAHAAGLVWGLVCAVSSARGPAADNSAGASSQNTGR